MQRIVRVVFSLGLGCTGCAADDGHDAVTVEEAGDDDQHAQDQAVCDGAPMISCPPGYGFEIIRGSAHDGLTVVDLSKAGTEQCGGGGVFVSPAELLGADRVGFDVTRNSVCTFGCFGGCPFFGACFAKDEHGDVACVHECSPLTEESCEGFVQECLGEGSCGENDDG